MFMNVTVTPNYTALRNAGKNMQDLPLLSDVFGDYAGMDIIAHTDGKNSAIFMIWDDTLDKIRFDAQRRGYNVEKLDGQDVLTTGGPIPNLAL